MACLRTSHNTDDVYPLLRSSILDSGSTIDVFNCRDRFRNFEKAPSGDYLWAADRKVSIEGYGTVSITVRTPYGTRNLRINDAAFCPTFICNVISLDRLKERDLWWDTRREWECIRQLDGRVVANVPKIHGQYVLEYVPLEEEERDNWDATFSTYYYHPSRTPMRDRPAKKEPIHLWHHRMGHPNPEVLQRLTENAVGVKIKGPTTVQCDSCG